ncbi:hypothetical protein [Sulfitobacter sp.]|uniref:hypothetical protein n=1 Tax=Sulfitobacter sp. TaxID=1903071 RepID=UPI003002E987
MTSQILVDGSNVLFWQGGQANRTVPAHVVQALCARRFAPRAYFDNSISRHITSAELDAVAALAEVIIAPRGTPADAMLLADCADGRLQIVSNDRFRTWRGQYPDLRNSTLVTGSIGKGGRVSFSKKLRPAPI